MGETVIAAISMGLVLDGSVPALVQDLWGQSLVVSVLLRAVSTKMGPFKLSVSILSIREESPVLGASTMGARWYPPAAFGERGAGV